MFDSCYQYPVITTEEPLEERYLSSPWNFRAHSFTLPSSSIRPPGTETPPIDRSKAKGKQRNAPTESVIAVKKKKKKSIKLSEPGVSKLGVGHRSLETSEGSQTGSRRGYDGVRAPVEDQAHQLQGNAGQQQSDESMLRYDIAEVEEFRNIWDSDKQSR